MNFDKTQQELLSYLKENKIWRNFLPLAEVLLLGSAVLEIASRFVSFGVFSAPIAFLKYVAIVLVLAKANYKVLTMGLGLLVVDNILGVLTALINRYPRFNASGLFWACIYALFALAAFKKSGMTVKELKTTVTSKEGIKKSMNLDEAKKFNMGNMTQDIKSASKTVVSQTKDIKNQVKQLQPKPQPQSQPQSQQTNDEHINWNNQ